MSACGKDDGCLGIAEGYAAAASSLEGAFSGLESAVSDLGSSIGSVSVPDDYLGEKIVPALGNIASGISSISGMVSGLKGGAISFARGKEQEHRQHYIAWKEEQERLRKEEEERQRQEEEKTE